MKMNFRAISIIIIYTGAISFNPARTQIVQYASRFRNFTIGSETGSAYLMSLNIYRKNSDHYAAVKINGTKDVRVKYLQIQMYRCVYEKAECEHVHKIIIDRNINRFIHMKDQFWTPAIQSFKPRLNFHFLKKGIYESEGMTTDTAAVLSFYSEATSYYYQIEGVLFDLDGKKAIIGHTEVEIKSFTKRYRNSHRGNSSTRT